MFQNIILESKAIFIAYNKDNNNSTLINFYKDTHTFRVIHVVSTFTKR